MYSIEEFDELKTKILKFVLYKKRTEQEVRQKFKDCSSDILEDVIDYLKDAGYVSDEKYIERSIKEYTALKNLSIKELVYKLQTKGIENSLIEDYVSSHKEELTEYEIASAKHIIAKKINNIEKQEIIDFLLKKGYIKETIDIAFEDE